MRIFERLLGRDKPSSGRVAKERLRLVLAHDRADIPPGLLDTLKDEIITVISRHLAVDTKGVQVTFSQDTQESRLVADIPLLAKRGRHKRA